MKLFNRLIVSALPLVPRSIVRRVAKRYVAGETLEQALETVRALNAEGCMTTLDVLPRRQRNARDPVAGRAELA